MGKSRKKWLNICNAVWAFIMVLLGFTACEHISADEYGMPYADYKIKGKVVDPQQMPKAGVRIIVKEMRGSEFIPSLHWDTLKTDNKGEFLYESDLINRNLQIKWEDIQSDIYKPDSIDIEMPKPTGGKGWYEGESTLEINITLKEKINEEDGE